MSTQATSFGSTTRHAAPFDRADEPAQGRSTALLDVSVPAGRVLFAAIFLVAGLGHFSAQTIAYAAQTGLPLAGVLVPLSGVMALVGGASVALGYHARIGAWLLVLFLVPVTLQMHAFWTVQDPMMAQVEQAMFMKNASMLGAALLLARWGAGPYSLDARRAHA
jgi:putative oxidoreductase